jgi:hypothetical protein
MAISLREALSSGKRGWSTVAGLMVASIAAGWLTIAPAAAAAAPLCEPFGSVGVDGYVMQNNRWGSSAPQCIQANDDGFSITQQGGAVAANFASLSYPSIFAGCHYGNCSASKVLPAAISRLGALRSTVGVKYVGDGTYNAAYDVWLDPIPGKGGVNATEVMIWLHRQGGINPVGSVSGNANLSGDTWEVWTGNTGQNDVVSYVAPASLGSFDGDLMAFVKDTVSRGMATSDWFVNSVQFGFEPWQGGVGLTVSGFSVAS